MVQIKFVKFGSNSAFGGFAPGETMRAPEALAKHLVEEAQVAEYVGAVVKVTPANPTRPEVPAAGVPVGAKTAKKAKKA